MSIIRVPEFAPTAQYTPPPSLLGFELGMPETLLTVFARQAADYPGLLFTRFLAGGEVSAALTYSQAWQLAGRWAALLLERGPLGGPGQPAVLAPPNTPDFVGAYFGVLR